MDRKTPDEVASLFWEGKKDEAYITRGTEVYSIQLSEKQEKWLRDLLQREEPVGILWDKTGKEIGSWELKTKGWLEVQLG